MTSLIAELDEALDGVRKGEFVRPQVKSSELEEQRLTNIQGSLDDCQGQFIEADFIKFDGVPVVAPNGDVLVKELDFEVKQGANCIITGPNGSGKSSLFRILGNLWPMVTGKLYKP